MLEEAQLAAVSRHLAGVLAADSVEIAHIHRFHGGASRETYAIDVVADGATHALILRCDPGDSLIDTPRELEFSAYRAFEGSGVPVPRAVSLCGDASVMGSPFFVMERIDGGAAESPFNPDAYGEHKEAIGRQFFDYLGRIHALDALASPLAGQVDIPAPDRCWVRELDYWEGQIEQHALQPEPIAAAAIRWLRRNPPPPAQKLAVVHGDYRNGNVLHDGKGRILTILDWEMAHIGDPLEDLAWALDPLWGLHNEAKAAGLIDRDEAVALWEAASGLRFDPGAFKWWEMFATLKGLAIWISSAHASVKGINADPVLTFSGWYPKLLGNQVIAKRLSGEMA